MNSSVDAFMPLARLTLGDGYDGRRRERWVMPLAQLLEAASRGKGQLPLSRCAVDDTAPKEFFSVADGMVRLPRYAACWSEVCAGIERRWGQHIDRLPDEEVRRALSAILPPSQEKGVDGRIIFDNAQQRLAAAAFVDANIGVLTGGPGTGKTASAATLLAIRKRLNPDLCASDVLLCAPTGKAACRLGESMQKAATRLRLEAAEREFLCALVPATLHKALEWTPKPPEQGGPFRRNAGRPLTQCLVLVDEASMVDLDLMTHLLRALPPKAALLLLGDSDQLESVETGGVLGELVSRGSQGRPAADLLKCWKKRLGEVPNDVPADGRPPLPNAGPLPGLVVRLHCSYRAKEAPWILELAAIAKPGGSGTAAEFLACCRKNASHIIIHKRRNDLLLVCRKQWKEAQKATDGWSHDGHPGQHVLSDHIRKFQLLCGDNAQVDRANRIGVANLWTDGADHGGLALPHGCPVLITQNRPALGLSNGDVGVALGPAPGSSALVVAFPGIAAPIAIAQLPEHQLAFALTIHKSQGSEWQQVAIDLPVVSEILDRNLLYTAITRSSKTLDLFINEEKTLVSILDGKALAEGDTVDTARVLQEDADLAVGPDHPATLVCLNNRANLLRDKGDNAGAEALYRQVFEERAKILGPDHLDTLASMNDLAHVLRNKGDYEAAEALYLQVLKVRQNVLGLEHPDTLKSVNSLALLFSAKGDRDGVKRVFKSLDALRKLQGIDPVCFRYSQACYECLSGNLEEARRLIAEEIVARSDARDQALKDDDLKAIYDFIRALPQPAAGNQPDGEVP